MRFWLFIPIFFLHGALAFQIPKGLTSADRKEVIRTVGMNSATKVLSNPYPLGGYSGFEVGYSVEFVNVRDIRRLGSNSEISDDTEWRYSRLTVGKGLYKDVDAFFSFMPPVGSENVSDYGAAVRWSFFQAQFLPINISTLIHFNQLNFNDSFMNRNYGAEVLVGVNVDNFSLYFGGGMIEARGTFIGTVGGVCIDNCTVTDIDSDANQTDHTVSNEVQETHSVVGLSLHYENLFTAAQVDRYRDAVYSMKLGLRF
jgi:hypothetical protein